MNDAMDLLAGLDKDVARLEFKSCRVQLRMSQAKVAGLCAVTPTYVTRLETGSWWPKAQGGFWTLEALIRKGLGMPVADFVARCEREDGHVQCDAV